MADRPPSIDICHPLLLKANDLVLLTQQDGDIPQSVPGFGLFYRDTCDLAAYVIRLHGTVPLLVMASDSEGMAAQMNLTTAVSRRRTVMPSGTTSSACAARSSSSTRAPSSLSTPVEN